MTLHQGLSGDRRIILGGGGTEVPECGPNLEVGRGQLAHQSVAPLWGHQAATGQSSLSFQAETQGDNDA